MKAIFLFLWLVFPICFYAQEANPKPSEKESSLIAAQRLYRKGELKQAVDAFSVALKQFPQSSMARLGRAMAYFQLKEYGKAKKDLDQAIKIDKGNVQLYVRRAHVLTMLQRYDAAIEDFSIAITIRGNLGSLYFHRGNLYAIKQWRQQAIDDYSKAIKYSNNGEAYLRRGKLQWFLGNGLLALQDFRTLMRDEKKNFELTPKQVAETHLYTGYALSSIGNYEDAEKNYSLAAKNAEFRSSSLLGRAIARKRLNKFKASLADYNTVIALRPQWAVAYFDRANLWRVLNKENEASKDYLKVVEISTNLLQIKENKEAASVYLNRARARLALGEDKKALKDFLIAYEIYKKRKDDFNLKRVLREIENVSQ